MGNKKIVWFNKTFSSVHSALQLIRIGDIEKKYELIASSQNPHALVKLTSDQFFLEPNELKGNSYIEWCLNFCLENNINIFVPGKEATLISERSDLFKSRGIRLLLATNKQNIDLINNKQRFYETVRCDIAPPAKWKACSNLDEFDKAFIEISNSCKSVCIKPAVSVYGIGFRRICTDRTALKIFTSGNIYKIDLLSLRAMLSEVESFQPLLVMEYLDGNEYSVDCLADYGILKCAIARKKPLIIGDGQIIVDRKDINIACSQIINQYHLNGMVNIQFREGQDGLCILEVNPRMSGGIAMACLAGPNLPYLGLAGFDQGYDQISIDPIKYGLRVGETNSATILI